MSDARSDPPREPLQFERLEPREMRRRAGAFHAELERRRSVRHFSDEPIPEGVLEDCIRAASSAPSGAHMQPWTFCVVRDPEIKRRIREAAEAEERELYERRISDEWREALARLGTDAEKPFLETAPALVVVLRQVHGRSAGGEKVTHYYTQESVGIAAGFLLCALHHAGLATLTHTPSPMGFLTEILGRPENERPFLLIPVGYPAPGCQVPVLRRKDLGEVLVEY